MLGSYNGYHCCGSSSPTNSMNYSKGFGKGEHREVAIHLQCNRDPSSHLEKEAGNFVKQESSKLWIITITCHPWATFS